MLSSPQTSRRSPLYVTLVTLFLLAIAAFSVIPSYITQQWMWNTPLEVPHLSQIKALQTRGLDIPGWQTLKQEQVEIGGHTWSIQDIRPLHLTSDSPLSSPVVVMLRPQTWHRDQPQVDWMDINGVQRWTADSQRRLQFVVHETRPLSELDQPPAQSIEINGHFLRGWNQQQTYAVLQWYAWSNGGDAAPSRWFWVDQFTQWRDRHRMPWVAVSVLIPIKPLGDIDAAESLAQSLGQVIQSTLMIHVFHAHS